MTICLVCELKDSKYKCKTCRLPYCSVACYKTHQASSCTPPTTTSVASVDGVDQVKAKLLNHPDSKTWLNDQNTKEKFLQVVGSPEPLEMLHLLRENDPDFEKICQKILEIHGQDLK